MNRATSAVLSVLFLAACVTAPRSRLPSNVAILPVTEAPELLAQCSRSTVSPVNGYWLPHESDIVKLEAALPRFRSESVQRVPSAPLRECTRQTVHSFLTPRALTLPTRAGELRLWLCATEETGSGESHSTSNQKPLMSPSTTVKHNAA